MTTLQEIAPRVRAYHLRGPFLRLGLFFRFRPFQWAWVVKVTETKERKDLVLHRDVLSPGNVRTKHVTRFYESHVVPLPNDTV